MGAFSGFEGRLPPRSVRILSIANTCVFVGGYCFIQSRALPPQLFHAFFTLGPRSFQWIQVCSRHYLAFCEADFCKFVDPLFLFFGGGRRKSFCLLDEIVEVYGVAYWRQRQLIHFQRTETHSVAISSFVLGGVPVHDCVVHVMVDVNKQ